jgi:hypothetical protein
MNHLWVLYDPTKETQSEKMTTEQTQFVLLKLKTKYINDFLIWREDWPKWKKLKYFLASKDSPFMNVIPNAINENEKIQTKNSKESSLLKMTPAENETKERVRSSIEFSDVKLKEVGLSEVFGNTSQQFDGDQFSIENASDDNNIKLEKSDIDFTSLNGNPSPGGRASSDQYKIELLLIHPKGGLFRTAAQDISLSGTFCEKIVPGEFHTCIFDLVIINNFINDDDYKRLKVKASIVVTDSKIYIKYEKLTDLQKNTLRAGLDYYLRSLKKLNSQEN